MIRNVNYNDSAAALVAEGLAGSDYRQPSVDYSTVGMRRLVKGQPGFLLICATAGTSSSGELATLTDATTSVTDGTVVWTVVSMNKAIPSSYVQITANTTTNKLIVSMTTA